MHDQVRQALKKVNFTGIAIVVLLLGGTAAFGIYPMLRSGTHDINTAVELKDSIARLEQLRMACAQAKQQVQEAEARLQEAEKQLASGPPDSVFNKELTEVAKASGIRIENMPPLGAPVSSGAYKTVQVTVSGSGDWESCYKFLTGLRAMKHIVRLDSAVIEVQDKEGKARASDKVNCTLTVQFSTFFMER
jgi:Tfp pilus assembly protein PilO